MIGARLRVIRDALNQPGGDLAVRVEISERESVEIADVTITAWTLYLLASRALTNRRGRATAGGIVARRIAR